MACQDSCQALRKFTWAGALNAHKDMFVTVYAYSCIYCFAPMAGLFLVPAMQAAQSPGWGIDCW